MAGIATPLSPVTDVPTPRPYAEFRTDPSRYREQRLRLPHIAFNRKVGAFA
jgi:hypothetical protein